LPACRRPAAVPVLKWQRTGTKHASLVLCVNTILVNKYYYYGSGEMSFSMGTGKARYRNTTDFFVHVEELWLQYRV
jgi:hypothetical protein